MNNPFIKTVVMCAAPNCGNIKLACNHWFICHMPVDSGRFLVKPWDDDDPNLHEDNVLPICGDQCAIKMFQVYLSRRKANHTPSGESIGESIPCPIPAAY